MVEVRGSRRSEWKPTLPRCLTNLYCTPRGPVPLGAVPAPPPWPRRCGPGRWRARPSAAPGTRGGSPGRVLQPRHMRCPHDHRLAGPGRASTSEPIYTMAPPTRMPRMGACVLVTLAALTVAPTILPAEAASLRGSRAAMIQQNHVAKDHGLTFFRTTADIRAAVESGDAGRAHRQWGLRGGELREPSLPGPRSQAFRGAAGPAVSRRMRPEAGRDQRHAAERQPATELPCALGPPGRHGHRLQGERPRLLPELSSSRPSWRWSGRGC
jgi:hypothetical protein